MATLTYVTGTSAATGYTRVGHNSSATNPDSVWSFSLTQAGASRITEVTFTLKWDNSSAGTGWSGSYSYTFAVSTSGASGTTAYSGSHLGKKAVTLSGSSGTATVKITGLSLVPGTTYYLRANFSGSTKSTMKAFKRADNTVSVTGYDLASYTITIIHEQRNTANTGFTVADQQTVSAQYGTTFTPSAYQKSYTGFYYQYNWDSADLPFTVTGNKTVYLHYFRNVYTAYFNKNGGSGGSDSLAVTYGCPVGNITPPTRTGYAFRFYSPDQPNGDQWYWASSGVSDNTAWQGTEDRTFYANWQANSYIVNFNAAGGSSPTLSKSVTYDSTYGQLPIPTRPAYNFLGWFTSASGGTPITESTIVAITANQVLYAHWEISGAVRVVSDGAFHIALPHVYTNGTYRQCVPYIYSDGSWKVGV